MAEIEKCVYLEDLDQKHKGYGIDEVGKVKSQAKKRQEELKELDYESDKDNSQLRDGKPKGGKKNRFMEE